MDSMIKALIRRAQFRLVIGRQVKQEVTEVDIIRGKTATFRVVCKSSKQLISYQTLAGSDGPNPALSDVSWPPLKVYHNSVETPARDTEGETEVEKLRRENAALRRQNDLFWDIIVRLRNEIRFQVTFWENGFKFGEWLSPDTMKRKLSGLRGALQYMREFYPNRKLDDERMD